MRTNTVTKSETWSDRAEAAAQELLDTYLDLGDLRPELAAGIAETGWTLELAARWLPDLIP